MTALVITGGCGAIGAAAAELYIRRNRKVFLLDRDEAALSQCQARLAEGSGRLVPLVCDVASADQVRGAFETIRQSTPGISGLINGAALVNHHAHLLDLTEADWDRIISVNLKGMFLCAQAAAQIMVEQRQGAIVNLGSLSSRRAHREQIAYDAAKGGVESLTRAMALDLAPFGVRVNALLPAAIATATMVQHEAADFAEKQALVPLGRYGRPEEVAEVCEFLIDRGSFITGQCLAVDGGLEIQLRPLYQEYLESPRFRREGKL
jgi:NAD(P)-dependent dehydrogenase (short-subunit alcohol dehydrogenase family)